jgi:hypothetical protein
VNCPWTIYICIKMIVLRMWICMISLWLTLWINSDEEKPIREGICAALWDISEALSIDLDHHLDIIEHPLKEMPKKNGRKEGKVCSVSLDGASALSLWWGVAFWFQVFFLKTMLAYFQSQVIWHSTHLKFPYFTTYMHATIDHLKSFTTSSNK